ncbi:uncharacterized protein LOC127860412 isoform X4 [Dreissena polymorpha]|uniref:uncharacterized protein LOC127860412 isoform X4 n=1 Tax=Dreissena polymorpha TaxID=45954 RepID=UPI002263BD64|nr:uncharacterized protein LOC127860412 isoform X4 [Dreissena polymorpha]
MPYTRIFDWGAQPGMVREGSLLSIFCLTLALFEMDVSKKSQQIAFIIDGAVRIVKAVSKKTTCADVITKLPNLQVPLAVFLSAEGVKKELPGKTKLLKVWRANAASKNIEFVIKRSEIKMQRSRKSLGATLRRGSFSFLRKVPLKKMSTVQVPNIPDTLKKVSTTCMENSSFKSGTHVENSTSVKLSLKSKFTTPHKTMSDRAISTRTISSTDTGYNSVSSGESSQESNQKMTSKCTKNRHRTVLLEDDANGPRHSTPVAVKRAQKRCLDCTLTEYRVQLDEYRGKSAIMHRFLADQTLTSNRKRLDRESLSSIHDQKERCRFLWERYCDSDTESEASDDSEFIPSNMIDFTRTTALRRESAFSDLRKCSSRFSLPATRFSLPTRVATGVIDEFDYSFNCSFPRMDGDGCEDDSSNAGERANAITAVCRKDDPVTDEILDSFMKTTTSFSSDDLELNVLERNVME